MMCVMILLGVRMSKTMPLSGAEWSVADCGQSEVVWATAAIMRSTERNHYGTEAKSVWLQ